MRIRARLLILLSLPAALGCGSESDLATSTIGSRDPILDPAAVERIVATFREDVPRRMAESGLPGMAVALVDRNGPLWVEGFGFRDAEQSLPVDERTTFSMQSTSKTVTATAALIAARDRLVDLDTPITEYLPDFTVNTRFESDPASRMTLRHLLGHRAGFTHEAPIGNNYVPDYESFQAHVESISNTWLRYPVGLHQAYSNLGVDLAGYILGRASGRGFATYVQHAVLDPLGMEDASYDWERIRAMENRATGSWNAVDSIPLEHALIPSGGLYASARDMARFLIFQLNDGRVDGETILALELLQQMREPSFPVEGQDLGYGLGLRRYERGNRYYYNHAGAGFGFKCHMSWYPDLGVGIAVLANSMDQNVVHSLAGDLIDELTRTAGLGPPPGPRPFADLAANDVDPRRAARLLGRYLGRGSRRVEVTREDEMLSLSLGGTPVPLRLVSETVGFVEFDDGERELFRFQLEKDRPSYVVRVRLGWHYDFESGPDGTPAGPDRREWERYLGAYEVALAGTVIEVVEVRRENGWLWLDEHWLLDEHEPGLFFTVKGEALDLRGSTPTWRNIPLARADQGN